MKRRDIRKYLHDIRSAGKLVSLFVADRSLEEYLGDAMIRSATERQFEIIGEALGQAVRIDTALADRITDAGRIIAFRNRLVHGYSSISDEVVWGVVESSLPRLLSEVAALLGEAEEPGD
jgi:uncharacterized protein with HEPN domain